MLHAVHNGTVLAVSTFPLFMIFDPPCTLVSSEQRLFAVALGSFGVYFHAGSHMMISSLKDFLLFEEISIRGMQLKAISLID